MTICKYCQLQEAIKNSHIIPKFISEWLKDTSATGYIRNSNKPNKRVQDSIKKELLCKKCETDFSVFETNLKKNIFSKIANYRTPCPAEITICNLSMKCIYSIAWRVLAEIYFFPSDNDYTQEDIDKFPLFLDNIKEHIESDTRTDYKIHVIPCVDEVINRLGLPQDDKINIFYERSSGGADLRVWDNPERVIIYFQIPFIIIIVELIARSDDIWEGTKIEGNGILKISGISKVPTYVSSLIKHGYQLVDDYSKNISPAQTAIIRNGMNSADKDCGTFKSMAKYHSRNQKT